MDADPHVPDPSALVPWVAVDAATANQSTTPEDRPVDVVRGRSATSAQDRDDAADLRDRVADRRDELADVRDRASDARDRKTRIALAGDGAGTLDGELSGDDRDALGEARDQDASRRDRSAALEDRSADRRDRVASDRDEDAQRRDRAAARRDRDADAADAATLTDSGADGSGGDDDGDARRIAGEARAEAALDRRRAEQDRAEAADERLAARESRDKSAEGRTAAGLDRDASAVERAASAGDRELSGLDREGSAADRAEAEALQEAASVDALTGVYLRGPGMMELAREVARARRTKQPLTVAFLDVDGLKTVNDAQGHAAGDQLLAEVAAHLQDKLRPYDLIFRYGGDEFVCALGGLTREEAAERLADVRDALAGGRTPRSFTAGLAELEAGESVEGLLARADAALYRQRRAS